MSFSDRPPAKLRREPSPDFVKAQVQQVMKRILIEIQAGMKRPEKPAKAYICYYDIKSIWFDKKRISALLQSNCLSPNDIDRIQKDMIIILSTLVYIGAIDCLLSFSSRFFDQRTGHLLVTDDDFPFEGRKLAFLDAEPAQQAQFSEHVFRFKPVVIEIKARQTTQKVHLNERLPFETIQKGVGAGGYGKVDCVGISPSYIIRESGFTSPHVFKVACKKIILPKDFDQEKQNLQVLKKSLTSHHRIMKHLTTLEHGPNRYILLPYAAYGDLEVFLHCGATPDGDRKYDFDKFFPGVRAGDVTIQLLSECGSLAHAIEWLHNHIKIDASSNTVFCAHMDLKPANILIEQDAGSLVGRWMVSDFGISVFKEETQQPDPDFGSIGDYVSQVTMNTRPTRQEGTYQAPEVKLAENAFSQAARLTPQQRGIGRKSDIWSFGCILSEVMAFSLGKEGLVRDFQIARKKHAGDDYFYSETFGQRSQYLKAAGHSNAPLNEYEVRPAVVGWLDQICLLWASAQNWVNCYVGTIRQILIVDTENRPDANELLRLLKHVKEHVGNSRGSSVVACPILDPKGKKPDVFGASVQENPRPIPPVTQPARITRKPVSPPKMTLGGLGNPTVLRSSTFEEEILHENQEDTFCLELRQTNHGLAKEQQEQILHPQGRRAPFIPERSQAHDTDARPLPHPVQDDTVERDRESKTGSGTKSSLFSSFLQPPNAHGIVVDPAVPMNTKASSFVVNLPKAKGTSHKFTSFALTRGIGGARLACLSKSSVYIYSLNTERTCVSLDRQIPLREIPLTADSGWKGIAASGNFIAVWGYSISKGASGKVVHFCDIRAPQHPREFAREDIALVDKISVSERGVAALVCGVKIRIATLDLSHGLITLTASAGQVFAHACFNDTGDFLFAWAYGQRDTLYVWRCQDQGVNGATESESRYETVMDKRGEPSQTRIIPYNSYQGCIIVRPDRRLFPAQIHSTLRDTTDTIPHNNEITLFSIHSACVFDNHSMVTLEKGTIHTYLKEYKINYGSTHHFTTPGTDICKLKSRTASTTQITAIKENEHFVIIICNIDGGIEFIKLFPLISE